MSLGLEHFCLLCKTLVQIFLQIEDFKFMKSAQMCFKTILDYVLHSNIGCLNIYGGGVLIHLCSVIQSFYKFS
jgi:hypothetical protein